MLHTEGRDFEILLTYMSKYILAKADVDWADEFSCVCFEVSTKDAWEAYAEEVKKAFAKTSRGVEIYFGTNEAMEIDSADEWFRNIKTQEITEDEANFLRKAFAPSYTKKGAPFSWGTGSGYFDILGYMDDDE